MVRKKQAKRSVVTGVVIGVILCVIAVVLVALSLGQSFPVLQPKGTIAHQEYILILITVGLGILVVVPVFTLLFTIAWKYRADNKKATYQPEFSSHKGLEVLWWGIPVIIIIILAIITAISTHALDPKKELQSTQPPLKIQVVALQWRWLFIYPEEKIATLGYVVVPKDRPIEFSITSDAPMNSFWVPALGGQIYAMAGMSTKLHLMAAEVGDYKGVSANISGEGFADMRFTVKAVAPNEFSNWTKQPVTTDSPLTSESYKKLAEPSRDTTQRSFIVQDTGLYDEIIMKYMHDGMDNSKGHMHHE